MGKTRFQKGTIKVLRQKSGRVYEGSWYVYLWKDGKEVRRRRTKVLGPVSSLTKNEAAAKLLIEISRSVGQPSAQGKLTVEAAKVRYVKTKEASWSINQAETFNAVWKNHISPSWGNKLIDSIERQSLQEWLNSLAENWSKSMVKKAKTYMAAVLEMAVADKICRENPAKRLLMPKTKRINRPYYTLDQVKVLINATETMRDRLILRIIFQTGLRPQELSVLRVNDFDEKQCCLRIDEAIARGVIKETKTETADGWVPLTKSLTSELADYIERSKLKGDTWIFHGRWPHMPFGVNDWRRSVLQPLAEKAELPKVDFRLARRTAATWANKHGGPKEAQGLMRHADMDTTVNVYVGSIPEEVRQAVEAMEKEMGI